MKNAKFSSTVRGQAFTRHFGTKALAGGLILCGLLACQESPSRNGPNSVKVEKSAWPLDELAFRECVTTASEILDAPLARLDAVREGDGPTKPLARISDTGDFQIWGQERDHSLVEVFDNEYVRQFGWQNFRISDFCGEKFDDLSRYAEEYNRALADRVDVMERGAR